MATILDSDNLTYVSFPIVKVDKTDDGDLLVWGKATDGSVDHDEQIVDPDWSGKALETWLKTGGNVRVMHSAQHLPAGVGVEVKKGDGEHWVRSLVVEPTAKRLVEKGVLRAYSVGISAPKIIRDRIAKGGRIVDGAIHELSLVDRPANKNCGITLVKGAVAEDVQELWGMDADVLDKKKKDADADVEDESYASETGEQNAEDEPDDDSDEDDVKKNYTAARSNWLSREPGVSGGVMSGTAFLAKRAAQDAWARWHAEGEEYGYHDPETGVDLFAAKSASTSSTAVDESVDKVDASTGAQQHDLFETTKSAKGCPKCGANFHADSKLRKCDKCGAKLPRADKGFVPFKKKPKPDTDADASTGDGDGDADDAPYAVKRMHDATCAAYDWSAVADEYPALKGVADAITAAYFRDEVSAAAVKGDMGAVQSLAALAQDAEVLGKGLIEAAMIEDARAWMHKGFTDLYPTQGPITPTTMTAGQFQRPYLAAGRAPLSAPASRGSNVPQGTKTPDPDDFQRPYLATGHAAPSPSNKGNLDTGGSLASGAARTFYANASKEATASAMRAMHDHIAGTFPGMCPMAASKAVMPPDMRDAARPKPVTVPDSAKAPGEVSKAAKAKGMSKKAVSKLIKSATKAVADAYESQIEALHAEIAELGAQPDPTQAPLRGVVRKAYDTDAEAVPVERISLVEKAQNQARTDVEEEVAYIAANFLHHPNPRLREQGEARIRQLLDS